MTAVSAFHVDVTECCHETVTYGCKAKSARMKLVKLDWIDTVDADEMAARVRHADVRYLPMAPARRRWQIATLNMGQATVYLGRMGSRMAAYGGIDRDSIGFAFSLRGDRWALNGREIGADEIASLGCGSETAARLDETVDWAAVFMPRDVFTERFRSLTGREPDILEGIRIHRPGAAPLGYLRGLLRVALEYARSGEPCPGLWEDIDAMLACETISLTGAPSRGERPAYRRLIGRCNEYLEEQASARVDTAKIARLTP